MVFRLDTHVWKDATLFCEFHEFCSICIILAGHLQQPTVALYYCSHSIAINMDQPHEKSLPILTRPWILLPFKQILEKPWNLMKAPKWKPQIQPSPHLRCAQKGDAAGAKRHFAAMEAAGYKARRLRSLGLQGLLGGTVLIQLWRVVSVVLKQRCLGGVPISSNLPAWGWVQKFEILPLCLWCKMLHFTRNQQIIKKNKKHTKKKQTKKTNQKKNNPEKQKRNKKKQSNLGCPWGSWNCVFFVVLFVSFLIFFCFFYFFPRKKTEKKNRKKGAAGEP